MKQAIWDFLYRFFPDHGHHLMPSAALYDWQTKPELGTGSVVTDGPETKDSRLQPDNPRLAELRKRYAEFDKQATTPLVWSPGRVTAEELRGFRGADIYVWQSGGLQYGLMAHALAYHYLRSHDELGLLDRMDDDAAFAVRRFDVGNRKVSRDLLDSILEINFIERELGLSKKPGFNILDIGAGYGRLAHRMVQAMPMLGKHLCTDAVPESTFICEHYLGHRGVTDKAQVVPLDEIERTLAATPVDLAVNIHSFSECSLEAIDWWAKLLATNRVPWLLVCPNAKHDAGRHLGVEDGRGFKGEIEKHGYRLVKMVPKFDDPVLQAYGLDPSYFHLFQLQ
ncbi:putative sugar O-methyltransferase [Haloferula sp. BvORR071]|uniref:putative sugar O-methyltransferase n=1 Tax=Haloferula sp. BvORR071 TaxID=1396141 RepID=UPI000558CDAF|nr:putative sugar O-methyltransferase [Haloferula sp. BvORR071]